MMYIVHWRTSVCGGQQCTDVVDANTKSLPWILKVGKDYCALYEEVTLTMYVEQDRGVMYRGDQQHTVQNILTVCCTEYV